jgi:hypothetical protein
VNRKYGFSLGANCFRMYSVSAFPKEPVPPVMSNVLFFSMIDLNI